MIKSMTGYAVSAGTTPAGEMEVESRSLNSKNLDIFIKMPKALNQYETLVREVCQQYVKRGKVTVIITLKSIDPTWESVKLNEAMIQHYVSLLEELKSRAGITQAIKLENLLQFNDIFIQDDSSNDNPKFEQEFRALLNQNFTALSASREKEGEALHKDFVERMARLRTLLGEIEPLANENPRLEFERLKSRLNQLLEKGEIDEARLTQEIALLADKVDVTEEMVRFKSHMKLFEETMNRSGAVGKKLNFVLQEMHRELNTMGVKTSNIDVSHRVVQMKEDVEKIREQIQNIE